MTRFYSSTAQPTTLSAAATSSATTIQVTATTGFPAAEFILALDYGTAQQELVKVTGVAGTTLTVVRGFDSTTAQAHNLGAAVQHVHSADDFRLSRTHEAASSGVHGATGALVGTSDAQALTNKDLTSGTNTFPASLATDAELSAHTGATAAHGTTGAIVGTSDAQALTNKDLTSGTNTFPASLVTLTGSQTLTNKTLTNPTLNFTSTNLKPSVSAGTNVTIGTLTGSILGAGLAIINGDLTTSGTISALGTLLTGLPLGYTPAIDMRPGIIVNTSTGASGAVLVRSDGSIVTGSALVSGNGHNFTIFYGLT